MSKMPRPKPKEPVVQVSVVIPESWLDRLDAVAEHVSDGMTPSRSTALRIALKRGLETIEAERKTRRGH